MNATLTLLFIILSQKANEPILCRGERARITCAIHQFLPDLGFKAPGIHPALATFEGMVAKETEYCH